jgi:hypothetical protein
VSFLPLELALAMFGVLSVFSVIGGALYERRNELGLETRRSPERTAELERRAEERDKSAAATLHLAELAAQGGGLLRIARALVADFDTRFPGVVAARGLAERLGR